MKALNRICQFLAIALGLGALVLFFFDFATFKLGNGEEVKLIGAQLGFGSTVTYSGHEFNMAKSLKILICFWLNVIALLFSGFAFKAKSSRFIAAGVSLTAGIYMLVLSLSDPKSFVDARPFHQEGNTIDELARSLTGDVADIKYSPFVLIIAICLLAFAAFAIAYLFIDDYLEVKASKGAKKTIFRRVIGFFKDYKSETKKIVWPGIKDVLKNTLIVLVMCLIIGALIWAVDYGLGTLIKFILGLKQ